MRNFTFQYSTCTRTNPICLAADRVDLTGMTHRRNFFPLYAVSVTWCVAHESHARAMWRDSSAIWQWRRHGTSMVVFRLSPCLECSLCSSLARSLISYSIYYPPSSSPFIPDRPGRWNRHWVPKRRLLYFRRRGNSQKNTDCTEHQVCCKQHQAWTRQMIGRWTQHEIRGNL